MNYFNANDDWETPIEYWKIIEPYVPKEVIINDPFYMNGNAKLKWKELGRDIVHNNEDFFKVERNDKKEIYISNPPHKPLKEVLKHLFYLDKPFVMLIPIMKICNVKIQPILKQKNLQIIPSPIYKGFIDLDGHQTRCPPQYYCYLCYKMDLPRDLLFI